MKQYLSFALTSLIALSACGQPKPLEQEVAGGKGLENKKTDDQEDETSIWT